ncbi:MAG: hypothetical protein JOZ32_18890, partial [Bryobacterales bacterium]|nr:hypothetical protein [Bryobacterales bacterium]
MLSRLSTLLEQLSALGTGPGLVATLATCLLATTGAYGQSGVTLAYNSSGLSSLEFNGTPFLSDGTFYLNQITLQNSDGSTFAGSTSNTVTVDPVAQTQTRTYSWGTIVTNYFASNNRLSFTVTVNNQSSATIAEIWLQPVSFLFPSNVQEYDGNTPLLVSTLGQPAVQSMTYNNGVMALAADDVTLPLLIGFPYASNRPTSTIFPLMLNTGRVSSTTYPASLPDIVRPIPAGASDQYHFSIRFGPAGSTRYTLAPDTFQAFAAAYPPAFSWADHRSVGALVLSTAGTDWSTNPRGWLLDPTIDVTSPSGVANLRTRILAWAATSAS